MRPRKEVEKDLDGTHYQGCIRINSEILLDIRELFNDLLTKGIIWTEKKEP